MREALYDEARVECMSYCYGGSVNVVELAPAIIDSLEESGFSVVPTADLHALRRTIRTVSSIAAAESEDYDWAGRVDHYAQGWNACLRQVHSATMDSLMGDMMEVEP